MNRQDKYDECRRRWAEMVYEGYEWHVDEAGLHLSIDLRLDDDHVFHPTALIERRSFLDFNLDKRLVDRLVFNIGMIELVSYWKCVCPKRVRVACGPLTTEQKVFWKKLYWHGLGEFFYTNGINATEEDFLEIEASGEGDEGLTSANVDSQFKSSDSYLVPIGGGKDSVVTLELLRRAGRQIRPLIMNPRGATKECARVAGFPMDEVLVIRRTIDPLLLDMNAQGYLNGHTPFSAMLAFYTLLASACSGIPNIALSNENSANEATVIGSTVNHQYSKSLEFENDFRAYVGPGYNYFSFLRPMTELQIARQFSRLCGDYYDVFRSCNAGSKQDIWCGHCAKCLFAYIILSPFIEPSRLNAIFGKPMLEDTSLRHEFEQLIGSAATKPFECVGTVGEVNTALSLTIGRYYADGRPALLNDYHPMPADLTLFALSSEHNLSEGEFNIIREACTENSN